MVRRCEVMGIQNVGVRVRLFDAIVRPVLLYGCEVWGPAVMQRGCLKKSGYIGDLEGFHKSFLRSCVGVRKSVHESVLMLELNRQPIVFSALKQVMGFAERVWRRDDGNVVRTALVESFDFKMVCVSVGQPIYCLGCLCAHGAEECVVGDVCGGECAMVDRVIE